VRRIRALCVVLLASACAHQPELETRQSTTIVAVHTQWDRSVRLELTEPDRFTLTLRYIASNHSFVFSSDANAPKRARRYRLVTRVEAPDGSGLLHEFESLATPPHAIQIATNIGELSSDMLRHMDVDRPPFAMVFLQGDSIPDLIPLNREGAPADERFQAAGPIPFEKGGKHGFRDKSGTRVQIEPRFDYTGRFRNGLASATIDGKSGYIDETGVFAIPPRFDSCWDFGSKDIDELALVRLDGKEGMINRAGAFVIPPKYDGFGQWFESGIISTHVDSRYGFVDRRGRVILEPKYESVGRFSGPLAFVLVDGKYGYIDAAGKFVIPPTYSGAGHFREGLAPVELDTGKWGYINTSGALTISAQFDDADEFWEGLARVGLGTEAHRKYGFIEPTGTIAIPIRYDDAQTFNGGPKCEAVLDGQTGWLYDDGRFEAWE